MKIKTGKITQGNRVVSNVIKKLIIFSIMFVLICSQYADAKVYNAPECGVGNISVPDEYMGCTLSECDEDFAALLTNNKFTFDTWKQQLMVPSNYVFYACRRDDPGKCIYVIFEKGEIQETVTNKDGSKTHKHMKDYNLIADGDEKDKFLEELKKALIFQGISQDSIKDLRWTNPLKETQTTYVEYMCNVGSDMIHCYETIYDGNKIKLQFSSKNVFTQTELDSHLAVLSELTYLNNVDYTEAKKIISENTQKKLEEETNSGENTKLIRYILSVSISLVVFLALFMAIKTQKKKRKKVVVLRDYEQVENTEDDN